MLDSSSSLLAAMAAPSPNRVRFHVDVVLESVEISHSVALTDKQLRIVVQRDNKQIQSDASTWRDQKAVFEQVVGLQSTLTMRPPSSTTSALGSTRSYEPKLYQIIIQALPSHTDVAIFELDIARYVNHATSLTLTPISCRDPNATLSVSVRCNASKPKTDSLVSRNTAHTARSSTQSGPGQLSFKSKGGGNGPPSFHRNSSLPSTETSSFVHGHPLDTASEYAEDLVEINLSLTKQLDHVQKQLKQRDEELAHAQDKIDLLKREIQELKVREAGETARGLQLQAYNLALAQEFAILQLQQHQIACGAPPTLVDTAVVDRMLKILEAMAARPPEPDFELDNQDKNDPTVSRRSTQLGSDLDDSSAVSLDDLDDLHDHSIVGRGNQVLVYDLRQLLARNQRLAQDAQLLVYSFQSIDTSSTKSDLWPTFIPKNKDTTTKVDLATQNKHLQAMNLTLIQYKAQFEATEHEWHERLAMALEEIEIYRRLSRQMSVAASVQPVLAAPVVEAARASPPMPPPPTPSPPPPPVVPPTPPPQAPVAVATAPVVPPPSPATSFSAVSPATVPPPSPAAAAVPVRRSSGGSELAKQLQTLKQENLALKFKNTTLESYQEKYEECEKERKRLEVRLLAQSGDVDIVRSRGNTLTRSSTDVDDEETKLALQRAAALDMQLNVLSELSRTQAMRIEVMNDEHVKLKAEFAQHIQVMRERMEALVAAAGARRQE
ncbi:hypothetical protein AC1031_020598 [Aphanomyces cochlioides]|nr:hypothetical protein AC1031_020598 [Aphanomyces cochlioides]